MSDERAPDAFAVASCAEAALRNPMSQPASAISNRRDRFRSIMRGLDGSGDPNVALGEGWYCDRPDGVAERLARSLEIRPYGKHLVVGSIGSGKTTEILRAKQLLEALGDPPVDYVDVGDAQEWESANYPGLGFVAAGAAGAIEDMTYTIDADRLSGHVVFLDGYDRWHPAAFRNLVSETFADIPSDIGLVCVGPPQLLADGASFEGDYFEQVHYCGAVDPESTQGFAFLCEVLLQRTDGFLQSGKLVTLLVHSSGGILRDLLLLARVAVEETYVHGHEELTDEDCRAAIQRFLHSMFRGLANVEFQLLASFDGAIEQVPPHTLEVLIARRALIPRYRPSLSFIVHPLLKNYFDTQGGD